MSRSKGRETKCAPLTVAVLDAGGTSWRSSARTAPASCGSTSPSAKLGRARHGLPLAHARERAEKHPVFFQAIAAVSQGRFVPAPGGVLIRDGGREIIGAVGVSGDSSDKDEVCAVAGIAAAGLTADTGVVSRPSSRQRSAGAMPPQHQQKRNAPATTGRRPRQEPARPE